MPQMHTAHTYTHTDTTHAYTHGHYTRIHIQPVRVSRSPPPHCQAAAVWWLAEGASARSEDSARWNYNPRPKYQPPIVLRRCYAMSGTDLGYAATRRRW
eukprot:2936961-Rhodomonas_salina.2